MISDSGDPRRGTVHSAFPVSSHLEKQRVTDGVVALVHELRAHNAYLIWIAVNDAVLRGAKLPGLENDSLEGVGKAAVSYAVEYHVAYAYLPRNRLIAGFPRDDPAHPIDIVFVIVLVSALGDLFVCRAEIIGPKLLIP